MCWWNGTTPEIKKNTAVDRWRLLESEILWNNFILTWNHGWICCTYFRDIHTILRVRTKGFCSKLAICFRSEWSKLRRKAQSIDTVAEKHSCSDEEIITVATAKNLITTDCMSRSNQRRKTSRQNAGAHVQRSDSHCWHQSAIHKWSTVHQFGTCWSCVHGQWGLLSQRDAVTTVSAAIFTPELWRTTVSGAQGSSGNQHSCPVDVSRFENLAKQT